MKAKILSVLKNNINEYVSGEEISIKLNISRTAVWKHMRSLKDLGYIIESQPKLGYKLTKIANSLHPREMSPLIRNSFIGTEITYIEQVGSTNEIAKDLAKTCKEGTIVLAEEQIGGKGRLGRSWVSPKGGGIWLSVILKPNINPAEAPRLTSVAALAVVKAIREETGLAVEIKWPNDIVFEGRKIAGILTEMSAEIDKINHIILGIGINVNIDRKDFPSELTNRATSIKEEVGHEIARNQVLASVLEKLENEYQRFLQGKLEAIINEVKEYSQTLGKMVVVSNFKDTWEGTVEDLDFEGALILRLTTGGTKRIISGDVSLRSSCGDYAE